jgi:5-methylthioribose kinase
MRAFSRYTPEVIPTILHYDDEKKILVTEWLHDYIPLQNFFAMLDVDSDWCRGKKRAK